MEKGYGYNRRRVAYLRGLGDVERAVTGDVGRVRKTDFFPDLSFFLESPFTTVALDKATLDDEGAGGPVFANQGVGRPGTVRLEDGFGEARGSGREQDLGTVVGRDLGRRERRFDGRRLELGEEPGVRGRLRVERPETGLDRGRDGTRRERGEQDECADGPAVGL